MSESPNSLINIPDLPPSVDNAIKNATDKPSLSIGTTFADLWDLVFGPISYFSEKRKIKYAHNLEIFRNQLESSLDQIPSGKIVEPSVQTTAQALENSKYCIDEENLREMFTALISKSMNSDYQKDIHPSFAEILKQMSSLDAEIIRLFKHCPPSGLPLCQYRIKKDDIYTTLMKHVFLNYPTADVKACSISLSSLSRLGLLEITYETQIPNDDIYTPFKEHTLLKKYQREFPNQKILVTNGRVFLTPLGKSFVRVCIPD